LIGVSERAAPHPRTSAVMAAMVIVVPIALALVCLAVRLDIIQLAQSMRAALLFALLLALMATGMPISIALGLSVLTYLFILSSVDPKMVGLKLFTSIDRFEIMAIPFFILSGSFLTSGGVARRMIAFASAMIAPCSRRSRDLRSRPSSASAPSSCPPSSRTAIRRASEPA
jgi:C4-dicarboxylate transporter DctM subunit